MTDSTSAEGPDPGTTARPITCDRQAGALALVIAQAAGGTGRRASRQAVLRVVVDAVNADAAACYIPSSDGAVRRVALAARDTGVIPSRLAAARRAVLDWNLAGHEPRCDTATRESGVRVHLTGAHLVLPLGPNGAGLVMAVVWPSEDAVAPHHVALIRRVAPTLQLALLPLVARTSPYTHAARQQRIDTPHADLIARLSHDLRTPLNTLGGFLELVLEERVGPLNDRQRELLGYARESATRLASLIEQIPIENTTRHAARAGVATKRARPVPSSYGS